jgi:hypothetical protein
MKKPATLLEKAARLRDKAVEADRATFTKFTKELREKATELERQAAAEAPQRPAEPSRDAAEDERKPRQGRTRRL